MTMAKFSVINLIGVKILHIILIWQSWEDKSFYSVCLDYNKNIIHATCILYWLDLTLACHFHDCKLSANQFANFGIGLIFSLFWDKFILQRMIARVDVTWCDCERSNQLTSVVWRYFWLYSTVFIVIWNFEV